MKHLLYILPLVFAVTACQKVIDVDLNSADPKMVVEAELSNQDTLFQVRLTQTLGFTELNEFPPVSNAEVSLSDEQGNLFVLSENEPGVYVLDQPQATPGTSYTLSILQGENELTASSFMPEPVVIDTIEVLETGFGESRFVNVRLLDPPGVDNFYRYILFSNGERQDDLYITDDRLRDGQAIDNGLFGLPQDRLSQGDTIRVVLQSIDRNVFEYFRTFLSLNSGQPTTAPANPLTNIEGDALGYFNACSETEMTVIIPD